MVCVCFFGWKHKKVHDQPKVVLEKRGIVPANPGLQGMALFYTSVVSHMGETSGNPDSVCKKRISIPW